MRRIVGMYLCLSVLTVTPVKAEWESISKSLGISNIQLLAVTAHHPEIMLAASAREVYKSEDSGTSWKRIFGLRSVSSQIHSLYMDPNNENRIYVASDQGIKVSEVGGSKWKGIFQPPDSQTKSVLCLARDPEDSKLLWVGSRSGLVILNEASGDFERMKGLPRVAVHAILFNTKGGGAKAIISTEEGLYKSSTNLRDWQKVSVEFKSSLEDTADTSLEQFNVEELYAPGYFSSIIHMGAAEKFYTATPKGIFESSLDASSWRPIAGQNLPSRKINRIEKSTSTFYAATDQGIYRWNSKQGHFEEFSSGLDSKEISSVLYSQSGDYLLAATSKGVFKFRHPELLIEPGLNKGVQNEMRAADILGRFKREPSILDIQNAATHYAEVHPEKIKSWRKAASRKALFPSLSIDKSISSDENIDLDRGGTNDPDEFIQGPNEKSSDWSVGLNWDISDLIWSGDQTTIDVRSKLMVELRDDILNEVTHLYFERRRLQIEMVLAPPRDLPIQLEKEIRLQELTAGIDALTGGYLSQHLDMLQ